MSSPVQASYTAPFQIDRVEVDDDVYVYEIHDADDLPVATCYNQAMADAIIKDAKRLIKIAQQHQPAAPRAQSGRADGEQA